MAIFESFPSVTNPPEDVGEAAVLGKGDQTGYRVRSFQWQQCLNRLAGAEDEEVWICAQTIPTSP